MALQNFVPRVTVVKSNWLNEVDVQLNSATDSGVANAYVVDFAGRTVAFTLFTGMQVRFTAANNNTTAATVNVAGTGVKSIVNQVGSPLTGGEILTTGPTTLQYNGTAWQIVSSPVFGFFAQTAAEIAAAVVPVNYFYPPGELYRYGTNTTPGTTDMTTAAQNWLKVGGRLTMSYPDIVQISAALSAVSHSRISLVQGCTFRTSTQNINVFFLNGVTDVFIEGGHVKQTSAGNTAHLALVKLTNATFCKVLNMELEGAQWSAISLDGSTDNDIYYNYIHDSLNSSAGDKYDITVYTSHRNNIGFNRLVGGQHGGVLVQDPNGSGVNPPSRNKVFRNIVGTSSISCKTYGIVIYLGGTSPLYNEVIGNHVENVLGDPAVQSATGSGIYCVGQLGLGGCKVMDNTVINCCQLTTVTTNGPAGISITSSPDTEIDMTVSGNTVEACVQGHGILISGVASVVVSGNLVVMPSGNNGTGPGGGTLAGNALKIINSDNVTVSGGRYIQHGTQDSVFTFATDANHSDIIISGVTSVADSQNPFRTAQAGGFTITGYHQISCTGVCNSNVANCSQLSNLVDSTVSGGRYTTGTQSSLAVSACTGLLVTCANWLSTGSVAVSASGTCTGSYFDKSNRVNGFISNTSTGMICEQLLNAAPTSASSAAAVGDRVEQSVPVVGNPKGWRCTVAGNPGTWVSEGNL